MYVYVVSKSDDTNPPYVVTVTTKDPVPVLKSRLAENDDWMDDSLEKTFENVRNLLRDELNVEPLMVSVQRPECLNPGTWWYEGLVEGGVMVVNDSEQKAGENTEGETKKEKPTMIPGLF